MRPPLLLPCLLALVLALGCARHCGTGDSKHVYFPGSGVCETVADTAARSEYVQLPFFAALAASAYHIDQSTGLPKDRTVATLKEFFDDEKSFYQPEGVEFMRRDLLPDLGAPHTGADLRGLAYYVFAHRPAGKNAQVFVVFRGTEDDFGDWFSNFRWVTRLVPLVNDEYDQLLRILPELGRALHKEYGDNATIHRGALPGRRPGPVRRLRLPLGRPDKQCGQGVRLRPLACDGLLQRGRGPARPQYGRHAHPPGL